MGSCWYQSGSWRYPKQWAISTACEVLQWSEVDQSTNGSAHLSSLDAAMETMPSFWCFLPGLASEEEGAFEDWKSDDLKPAGLCRSRLWTPCDGNCVAGAFLDILQVEHEDCVHSFSFIVLYVHSVDNVKGASANWNWVLKYPHVGVCSWWKLWCWGGGGGKIFYTF